MTLMDTNPHLNKMTQDERNESIRMNAKTSSDVEKSTIGVFYPTNNDEHYEVLSAFHAGLIALGENAVFLPLEDYFPVDIAVVFGVRKKNVPVSQLRGKVIDLQKESGRKTIVLEKGYVKRNEYYSAGFNNINGRADFDNKSCDNVRWNALNVSLKPWRTRGRHIVLCGQVPSDASVQHIDIISWCVGMVPKMEQRTGRPIIFRPHPLAIDRTPSILGTKTSYKSLPEDLADAWAVVTFNSNTAVEAAIEGIPIFAFDEGSMALPIANRDIDFINCPRTPDRIQWANNLAYAQWNLEEMSQGLPWRHLTRNFMQEQRL